MAQRKPKGKHILELHFDTKVGIENFMAWYLDGGGEQDSQYYTESWGKSWMHIKPNEYACSECEYDDNTAQEMCNDHSDLRVVKIKCTNCGHEYQLDNPFCEEN
jgi:hypothetical protein